VPPDRIVLRDGLELPALPDARDGFEHFAWRDLEMIRELDAFLSAAAVHRRLLDVGALHGLFSMAFVVRATTARALAVEPSPLALPILRQHASALAHDRIHVVASAAGESAGSLILSPNWHHLEIRPETSTGQGVAVPVATLDEICDRHDFAPDVVKIDVEGMEGSVLRGATEVLRRRPLVCLELHPAALTRLAESLDDVMEPLLRFGYAFDLRRLRRARRTTRLVLRAGH
jgi:FkbM family methyltransferase